MRNLQPRSDPRAAEVERLRDELARSQNLVQTLRALVPREPYGRVVVAGNLRLDCDALALRVNGAAVALPLMKFQMLKALCRARGELVRTAALLAFCHPKVYADGRNLISVHVSQMRRLLGQFGADVDIRAVRGAGYRLMPR